MGDETMVEAEERICEEIARREQEAKDLFDRAYFDLVTERAETFGMVSVLIEPRDQQEPPVGVVTLAMIERWHIERLRALCTRNGWATSNADRVQAEVIHRGAGEFDVLFRNRQTGAAMTVDSLRNVLQHGSEPLFKFSVSIRKVGGDG